MGTGVSANPISSSASDYVFRFLIILWLLSVSSLFWLVLFILLLILLAFFVFYLYLLYLSLMALGTFSLQRYSVFSFLSVVSECFSILIETLLLLWESSRCVSNDYLYLPVSLISFINLSGIFASNLRKENYETIFQFFCIFSRYILLNQSFLLRPSLLSFPLFSSSSIPIPPPFDAGGGA